MKLSVLCENTTKNEGFIAEHGLSLYIETESLKILFDMGQTDAFIKNAEKLDVGLADADIAVISHGHYDHGGGLKHFLGLNKKAKVYINSGAFGDFYNKYGKYIGLERELSADSRVVFAEDGYVVGNGIELCNCNSLERFYKTDNFGLQEKKDGVFINDSFSHEQYLLITENEKRILVSGCSHKGVLNILKWFSPDVFIGGFHFMKTDINSEKDKLTEWGNLLSEYPTSYYTCHCTGVGQFELLKEIVGDKLSYISCGETVIL